MINSRLWSALTCSTVLLSLYACSPGDVNLSRSSAVPTAGPTTVPTTTPSTSPSTAPSTSPTTAPSTSPTTAPSTTPTTTPTTAPTTAPTSSAAIVLNPTSSVISAQGSGCATTASFSVSETGYTGSFTAVSANAGIASVAPTAGVANNFTITSVTTTNGGLGTTIAVKDASGQSASEQVTIATCLP